MVSPVLARKRRRELWRRKGAIAALLLIVMVGIGCYVGFAGIWCDMDSARHRYYTGLDVRLKRVARENGANPQQHYDNAVAYWPGC